jgi:dTDP-4-amino-4,6-dideoxygalactose transaminase
MDLLPFARPSIDEATVDAVAQVLRSGWLTTGPKALEFESVLSSYFGGRPVRVMSSATAALEIALRIAGVGPGDEVITTPLSWIATANVILAVGATPVFVDVDATTRNIDLDKLEAAITPRTRALLPVDMAGLPVDRERLHGIARPRGLRVIEDAAQAFGASWRGQRIGSAGDLAAFSFHANKNITTGEGGCLVMNSQDEARLCEKLRLQGVTRTGDGAMDADVRGGKSNMTDIAAAIGLGQMRRLAEFTERRRLLASFYFAHFDRTLGFELPLDDFTNCNWHMFQPLLPARGLKMSRTDFIEAMRAHGIGVGVHYPAMHLFTFYRRLGFDDGDFPVAEDIGRRTVTLPLFPAMAEADVLRVCETVTRVVRPALT